MFNIFLIKTAQYDMMTKPAIKNIYKANKVNLTYIMRNDKDSTQARIVNSTYIRNDNVFIFNQLKRALKATQY